MPGRFLLALVVLPLSWSVGAADRFVRVDWVAPFYSDTYVSVTRQNVSEHASCRTYVRIESPQARAVGRLLEGNASVAAKPTSLFDSQYVRIRVMGLKEEETFFVDMKGVAVVDQGKYGHQISRADLKKIRDVLFPGCDPLFDNATKAR